MPELSDFILAGQLVAAHHPCPRVVVTPDIWRDLCTHLAAGQATLLDLWGEPDTVHMAVFDSSTYAVAIFSLTCPERVYPSVSRVHAPAMRLERALADMNGLVPQGLPDPRPWLDHDQWGLHHPNGSADVAANPAPTYQFLPSEGENLHQVLVGPVHAGIIEPGHFRITASGETIVRLEQRLGYTHKGVENLLAGASLARAAKLAARTSGDSTVAYGLAFARAVEAATATPIPERAVWLRALMAELERLANHLGDIGAICNDAAFALIHAHFGVLRERVLRSCDDAFGHRMMRDAIVPGGTSVDLTTQGAQALRALLAEVRLRFPRLVELYDNTASLQDRTVTTGRLSAELASQFGAGGYIGRASGRDFDVRRCLPFAPYPNLTFLVPVLMEGDVNARIWIRIREVEQSLSMIAQMLEQLPQGAIMTTLAVINAPKEGMALVEGFRGDIFVWLRLTPDGNIERCRLRDPSWFQWPLFEAAIEGNIVADLPICNKSFNCSYSGHDL